MPRPPANLSELSAEDLRRIEGQERENVEARIQWLRDIQALMDGAMVMISQYNTVAAQLRYSEQSYLDRSRIKLDTFYVEISVMD